LTHFDLQTHAKKPAIKTAGFLINFQSRKKIAPIIKKAAPLEGAEIITSVRAAIHYRSDKKNSICNKAIFYQRNSIRRNF